jgi:hypothetical protein
MGLWDGMDQAWLCMIKRWQQQAEGLAEGPLGYVTKCWQCVEKGAEPIMDFENGGFQHLSHKYRHGSEIGKH